MNFSHCSGSIKAILFDCDGTLVDSEYAHYVSWKQALNDLGSDLSLEDYYQYVGKSGETNAKLLVYRNNLKNRNLATSAFHQNLDFDSSLASRQWSLALNQNSDEPPCQNSDSSSCFGIEKTGKSCADVLLNMKKEYYHGLCKEGLPPIEATLNFLKSLAVEKKSLGIKIGVCSAARKEEILAHLRHLEIEVLLDIVLSGKEDLHEYFDPEGVNKPKPYIYLHAMKLLGVSPNETVVIEDSAPGISAGVSAGCFTVAIPNSYTKHHDFSHANLKLDSFLGMSVNDFLNRVLRAQNLERNIHS